MPVDEKTIDAVCSALADNEGPVRVDRRRTHVFLEAGTVYAVVGESFDGRSVDPLPTDGPAPLTAEDYGVLVDVLDGYMRLVDEVQHLPGAVPFPVDVRATIKAVREKCRARL